MGNIRDAPAQIVRPLIVHVDTPAYFGMGKPHCRPQDYGVHMCTMCSAKSTGPLDEIGRANQLHPRKDANQSGFLSVCAVNTPFKAPNRNLPPLDSSPATAKIKIERRRLLDKCTFYYGVKRLTFLEALSQAPCLTITYGLWG